MSENELKTFMKQNLPQDQVLKFTKTKLARLQAGSKPGVTPSDHAIVGFLGATFALPKKGKKYKVAQKVLRADKTLLPDAWRNDVVPSDMGKYEVVDTNPTKYNLATRPQAQKKCGSCFAFACATAISDAFVFGGGKGRGLPYNPLNSPLDILSCVDDVSNDKCDGGNPLGVLTYLSDNKGIVSSHCVSYDNWVEGKNLSSEAVPLCAGCYIKQCEKKPKPYRYHIKPPVFISSSDASSDGEHVEGVGEGAVHDIKLHLVKFGAAITGFAVLNNFLSDPDGSFHETNGIYFENKVYDTGKGGESKGAEKKKGDDPFVCAGGHAVCIVGWGVSAKPITLYYPNDLDPNKKSITIENCPYWVARNSWGRDWGDGGYFKMAMYQKIKKDGVEYEVNPNVAFERFRLYNAKMLDKDGNVKMLDMPIGGVVMIEPGDIVPDTVEPRDAPPYTNEEMKKFYCSDSELPPENVNKDVVKGEKDKKASPQSALTTTYKSNLEMGNKGGWGWVIFVLFLFLLFYYRSYIIEKIKSFKG